MIMDMDLLKFRTLKSKLDREGSLSLRVASESMVPVLKTGQIITVKRADLDNLKKFDILVFLQNEKIMCHFLWSVQTNEGQVEFITKSIENPTEIDIPIKEGLLLGKVDATIPLHIKIKIWLKNL
ncbi:MAG: signal peptidase I [Bacteriovoracaceae bacterium]